MNVNHRNTCQAIPLLLLSDSHGLFDWVYRFNSYSICVPERQVKVES